MTEPMTPERVAELRTRYPSLKFVGEMADEIDRLRAAAGACTEQLDAWLKRNGGDWDGHVISYARVLLTGEDYEQ